MNELVPVSSRIDLPYFPQWESGFLIHDFVQGKVSATFDPYWQESGACSPEEYADWAKSICGMACLKSILTYIYGESPPIIELAKACTQYGGYKQNGNDPKKLYYAPFVEFILDKFQLQGKVVRTLDLEEILQEVEQRNFVMASVNAAIRNPQSTPTQKGGHLVLVTGYNLETQTLSFHDPAGDFVGNQSDATVSFANFMKFFGERGIVIENPCLER